MGSAGLYDVLNRCSYFIHVTWGIVVLFYINFMVLILENFPLHIWKNTYMILFRSFRSYCSQILNLVNNIFIKVTTKFIYFLGLRLLLPYCTFVDMIEYIPSVRVSRKCHYYDLEDNPSCTFGVWHPLAAEKLLTYHLNSVDDREVLQRGYVRVTGFRSLNC